MPANEGLIAVIQLAVGMSTTSNSSAAVACAVVDGTDVVGAWSKTVSDVPAYEGGQRAKREVPCLMAAFALVPAKVREAITLIAVAQGWFDGHYTEIGLELHRALDERIPVVGVAGKVIGNAPALELSPGGGEFIRAYGMSDREAARRLLAMPQPYDLSRLLRGAFELAEAQRNPPPVVDDSPREVGRLIIDGVPIALNRTPSGGHWEVRSAEGAFRFAGTIEHTGQAAFRTCLDDAQPTRLDWLQQLLSEGAIVGRSREPIAVRYSSYGGYADVRIQGTLTVDRGGRLIIVALEHRCVTSYGD